MPDNGLSNEDLRVGIKKLSTAPWGDLLVLESFVRQVRDQAYLAGQARIRELEAENQRLRQRVEELEKGLRLAINTVECASIDLKSGEDLPWYANARKLLEQGKEQGDAKE